MTITLRLKHSSTTYNFINSGVFHGATYYPQAPEVTVAEVIDNLKNGSNIRAISRRNVKEVATLILKGAASSVLDAVRNIELAMTMADRDDVYVEYSASGTAYRSRIVGGSVNWSDRAKLRNLQSSTVTSEVFIEWTREYFWESTVEEQITVSSAFGTDENEVEIDNRADAWVEIGSSDIDGAIPAPARIRIKNNNGESRAWRWVWMSNNVWNDALNFSPRAAPGGSDTWTDSSSHVQERMRYEFPEFRCIDMAGDYFRVLWYGALSPHCYMKGYVCIVNDPLYVRRIFGQEVSAGVLPSILDLGIFPLPPGAATGYTGFEVSIRDDGSGFITTDALLFLPVTNGRRLHMTAYEVADGESIEDDGIDGRHYFVDSSGATAPYTNAYEQPIYLVPNRYQKLWIYVSEGSTFDEDMTKLISIWYRPRRLTM